MVANILKFLLIEIIFKEVITSYAPQTQKYIQVPAQQYYQFSAPAQSYATPPTTAYQSISPTIIDYSAYIKPKPCNTAVEKNPPYKRPVSISEQPIPVSQTSTSNAKNLPSLTVPPFDPNVLNNLAIALQLLIVSNLLNMPVPEQVEKSGSLIAAHNLKADEAIQNPYPLSTYRETDSHLHYDPSAICPSPQHEEYQAYLESNLDDQPPNPQYLPSANFLGSSNSLGGLLGSLGVPPAKARPGLNLKSPYDAMVSAPDNTPSSPYEYRKSDFQSPYSAILAADKYKDLFSMDFY